MQSPGKDARPAGSAVRYERHRPETTLLYPLVEAHYPILAAQLASQGTPRPEYIQREFTDYLRCGRLEHGFLRVRCESCTPNIWWRSAASVGAFAPVAAPGVWQKVLRCWSTARFRLRGKFDLVARHYPFRLHSGYRLKNLFV